MFRQTNIRVYIVLIFLFIIAAHAGWEYLNSGTTVTLRGVCFRDYADADTGYVVGDAGLILKTTDSGDSWNQLNSGVSVALNDISIMAGAPNIIYAVGENGIIIKTTNDGATWQIISSPTTVDLMGVTTEDNPDPHVYIVGKTNAIYKSTNGGQSWTTYWMQGGLEFNDVITNYSGYWPKACGYSSTDGYLLKSSDGGTNWYTDFFSDMEWYSVTEASKNVWWVGGKTASSQYARVAVTQDSGHTYNIVYVPTTLSTVYGVSADNDYCFAVGDGFIEKFSNFGQNYVTQVDSCPILYSVFSPSRNFAWAVGENGTIMRTTDGGGGGVIRVTYPDGGEYWEIGNTYDITWIYNNVTGNVKIELYKGGGFYSTVTNSTPCDGQYSYNVPITIPQDNDYQIKVTSLENQQVCDLSDDYFIIGSGVNITITYPNGGEFLKTRDSCDIAWTSNGFSGNVRIWLYKNDNPYEYIIYNTSNTGSYTWYIPSHQPRDTTYKIRIQSVDYPTVDDFSDDYFSIGKQIAVIQPTTGDTLYAGQIYDILWDSSGIGGNISIEYSTDGGWEWDTVTASTPDDGSYSWLVPNTPTEIGRVLIKHLSYNNTNNAQSDGWFTIIGTGKSWTIMVYQAGDNDLEPYVIDELNEMERGIDTSLYNVVIEMDRIWGGDTSNGNWETTRDYYILPDTSGDRVIRSLMLVDHGELNMGDPSTLSNFVCRYINQYPAQRYMVIIENHGNGWRHRGQSYDPLFRGICDDITDFDWIGVSNHEYYDALKVIYDSLGHKVDILAHDACLMGMHEVAYEARNFAKYMVFSEMMGWADYMYPYTEVLNWLNLNPNATSEDLSTTIVTEYINQFPLIPIIEASTHSALIISSEYELLCQRVDEFAQALITAGGISQTYILQERLNTQEYPTDYQPPIFLNFHHVDLFHFAQRISNSIFLPQYLRVAAESLLVSINDVIVAEDHRSSIAYGVEASHGIAIYYPRDPAQNNPDYANLYFAQDYPYWWQFLQGTVNVQESTANLAPSIFYFYLYPNPSSGKTTILYSVPKLSNVSIKIYDVSGSLIKIISDDAVEPGHHKLNWDGLTDRGLKVSSGIYFLKFEARDYTGLKKLILLK